MVPGGEDVLEFSQELFVIIQYPDAGVQDVLTLHFFQVKIRSVLVEERNVLAGDLGHRTRRECSHDTEQHDNHLHQGCGRGRDQDRDQGSGSGWGPDRVNDEVTMKFIHLDGEHKF